MTPPPQANPTPPAGMEDRAIERARRLLAGRLQRGGISTIRPEWFFEAESGGPPQGYPGGWQVRVRTWRHWSDARVHLEATAGEVLYRCVDRLADPPTDAEIAQDDALRAAEKLITIPKDARVRSFWHEPFADGHKVARLEWAHFHRGLRVDGDYLWVQIHPTTRRLIAFGRKWRTVRLT